MSGGVDSSVALYLLKKQGYQPIGISLKYDVWQDSCNLSENVCCSKKSFEIAKEICDRLGVPHHIVEVKSRFKKEVIDYFTDELKQARTPSPCVFCNRNLKFKVLLEQAEKFNADFVATGHYARIKHGQLSRASDNAKDQTYSLCFLPQAYLSKIIFPLGDLTKDEVYGIAKEAGFNWFEKVKQSQDFCFVSGSAIDSFLEKEIGVHKGNIVSENGAVLGEHRGLHFYTIGQRKGVDLSNGPYFVVSKDSKHNRLVVSKNEQLCNSSEVELSRVNFISGEPILPLNVTAKIRSTQELSEAILQKNKNIYKLVFAKPQRAVTSGQIAVFYDGEACLGGGIIS